MPRKITLTLSIVLASLICIGGFKYYELHTQKVFISKLLPHVKNSSLRFSNTQKMILGTETDRTYQNVPDEFEEAIKAVNENILATQTISEPKYKPIADKIINYQSIISNLLRSEKNSINANALLRAKMEAAKEANKIMQSTNNSYVIERANKLALEALEEAQKHIDQSSKSSEKSKNLLIEIQNIRKELATILPIDSLIEDATINQVIAKLSKQ